MKQKLKNENGKRKKIVLKRTELFTNHHLNNLWMNQILVMMIKILMEINSAIVMNKIVNTINSVNNIINDIVDDNDVINSNRVLTEIASTIISHGSTINLENRTTISDTISKIITDETNDENINLIIIFNI